MEKTQPPIVLTRKEAAELCRMSLGSFDTAVERGNFDVIRVGRKVLVPRKQLERVLNGEQPEPKPSKRKSGRAVS